MTPAAPATCPGPACAAAPRDKRDGSVIVVGDRVQARRVRPNPPVHGVAETSARMTCGWCGRPGLVTRDADGTLWDGVSDRDRRARRGAVRS